MAAAGMKIASIAANSRTASAVDESGASVNTITKRNETDCTQISNKSEENSSFCILPALKELQSSIYNDLQRNNVPLESSKQNVQHHGENIQENLSSSSSNRKLNDSSSDYVRLGDIENISATQLSPGLSLLQQTAAASSPPPHSYRHSRAYRHFKNPPQPHMCIRTTTEAGEELFINVLSWTRIVIPQEPSDPIPLYGGMRVPPGSPRSPPIVFAVMANPEVLKDSGRHSKDPEERRAMVELMCDFVEAMNPGVKLVRNAIILKDRDISGELKDVWNAVQAQRDREREEQMLLQRQQHQQHFHNINSASTTNGSTISNCIFATATVNNPAANVTGATTTHMLPKSMQHSGTDDDSTLITTIDICSPTSTRKNIHEVQSDNNASNIDVEKHKGIPGAINDQVSLALLADNLDNKISTAKGESSEECNTKHHNIQNTLTNDALSNVNGCKDSLQINTISGKTEINNQLNAVNCNSDAKKEQLSLSNGSVVNCNAAEVTNVSKTSEASIIPNAAISIPAQNPPSTAQQAPVKKEKLGGFLPNACIFPRFTKNNKHKDKDKDKEPKTKDKEKNALLSALKKSKDKKSNAAATAANTDEKNTSSNSKNTAVNCNHSNSKQQKNCLQQLECGVQKLELNCHHNQHSHTARNNINNSNVTITNSTIETSKNTSSTTSNSDSVGVATH